MAVELKTLRSVNSKLFEMDDGKLNAEIHIGHIHYDNKLGLGDGVKGLRGIDWDLQWNDIRKGWYFEHHSFHPFIPEYADQWSDFRDLYLSKDQTIKIRPVCNHVKGRLVKKIEGLSAGANAVIYDDAYGQGIDLIMCFTRSTFRRVIRFRDGYYPKTDISYDFEVTLPDQKELYINTDKTKVDVTKDYTSDESAKMFLVGKNKEYSYFWPFRIWDSRRPRMKQENIVFKWVVKNGKTYLRKEIPAYFFQNAVGDVYTDDSQSPWIGAGDGDVYREALESWDTQHDHTDGTAADSLGYEYQGPSVGEYGAGNLWLMRFFLPCNMNQGLTGIPAGATITAVDFKAYVHNLNNDDDDFVAIVQTDQPDPTTLTTADYNNCGATDNPTKGSADIAISTITDDQYNTFPLNATGVGWVQTAHDGSSYAMLGMRTGNDIADTGDGVYDNTVDNLAFRTSEYTGTGSDPYLVVTYTPPGMSGAMTTNTGYWGW